MASVPSTPVLTPKSPARVVKGPVSIEQNLALAVGNEQDAYVEDTFWPRPQTDVTKWDKYCPYQLLVVKRSVDSNTKAESYEPYQKWQYTFPLPPTALRISMPFAIQGTVQQDGYFEEHNGAPLRHITITGTTGVLPLRKSGVTRSNSGPADQLESIFGGTVNTIRSAVNNAQKSVQSIIGQGPEAYNVHSTAEFSPDTELAISSGFKQITLLRDFLESYVAIKKNSLGKDLRLALAIWKEDQVLLITPNGFETSKDSSSSLETYYTLSMTAWKRVRLSAVDTSPVAIAPPVRHSPNLIARALNTILFARNALQKISTLKANVLGDVDYVFKPLDDTVLLCKDLQGAILTVEDLPSSVRDRVEDHVQRTILYPHGGNLSGVLPSPVPVGYPRKRKVLSADLGKASVSSLQLPSDITADINKGIGRVRALRRQDFDNYAATLQSVSDKVAFLIGAGDLAYADTYGLDIAPLKSSPSQGDWATLTALQDSVEVMRQFAATSDGEPNQAPSLLDRFGGIAQAAGIAWKKPVSKFAIPFPFGATLEGLAATYLGNPDRFVEIVALNGLRAPWVDEVGYSLPLTANGKGQTVVVAHNEDLHVGKQVWLTSRAANRLPCKIRSIETRNGLDTLKLSESVDAYRVQDEAVLEAFLTGTTNSRCLIWIPSEQGPLDTDSVVTKDIPGVDVTDPMVEVGGVDLLLDSSASDLALVDGDLVYAVGLANIVQWVRYVFLIRQGELLQHRNLGLPLSIGLSLADFSAQDVVTAIRDTLGADPAFGTIDYVRVDQVGPTVNISIGVTVAGVQQTLPLTYQLKLS